MWNVNSSFFDVISLLIIFLFYPCRPKSHFVTQELTDAKVIYTLNNNICDVELIIETLGFQMKNELKYWSGWPGIFLLEVSTYTNANTIRFYFSIKFSCKSYFSTYLFCLIIFNISVKQILCFRFFFREHIVFYYLKFTFQFLCFWSEESSSQSLVSQSFTAIGYLQHKH